MASGYALARLSYATCWRHSVECSNLNLDHHQKNIITFVRLTGLSSHCINVNISVGSQKGLFSRCKRQEQCTPLHFSTNENLYAALLHIAPSFRRGGTSRTPALFLLLYCIRISKYAFAGSPMPIFASIGGRLQIHSFEFSAIRLRGATRTYRTWYEIDRPLHIRVSPAAAPASPYSDGIARWLRAARRFSPQPDHESSAITYLFTFVLYLSYTRPTEHCALFVGSLILPLCTEI